ncbi:serine/threonine protein kinase [Ahniella affigens]|uniref:serine/threonine protein kinase n=1 Tax=Ahniella affigens TaxID=2021234 RepID=UPI0014756048|nr:serine/threonine-protein kinase [Ahniella affigens]
MSSGSLKSLFDELVQLPEADRRQRLDDPTIDPGLRDAVLRLLRRDDETNPVLDSDRFRVSIPEPRLEDSDFGPYRVKSMVGAGGMGQVWLVHRDIDGVSQPLALKLMRRDRIDDVTLERFRLERRVLATLQHPAIARLVDAGETEGGQPWLVMEFIDGIPITRYSDRKKLNLRRRVKMFRLAAAAIAFAHRRLIVHRDIKPSNVLVTANGDLKIIDFGIAKPIGMKLGEADVLQTDTAQRFLSPQSAAPEQWRGDLITPACDIYSLGALLYELISGQPVVRTLGQTLVEVERQVLELEPPPPSAVAAAGREKIDDDLDAICMVCLRKEPDERYESVSHLLDDLDAWLASKPVAAHRGGAWYRAKRFAHRNRRRLAIGALWTMLAVTSGTAWYTSMQTIRINAEAGRQRALLLDAMDQSELGGLSVSAELTNLLDALSRDVLAAPAIGDAARWRALLDLAHAQTRLGALDRAENLMFQVPDCRQLPADLASYRDLVTAARLMANGSKAEAEQALRGVLDANQAGPYLLARWLRFRLLWERQSLGDARALLDQPGVDLATIPEAWRYQTETARVLLLTDVLEQEQRIDDARLALIALGSWLESAPDVAGLERRLQQRRLIRLQVHAGQLADSEQAFIRMHALERRLMGTEPGMQPILDALFGAEPVWRDRIVAHYLHEANALLAAPELTPPVQRAVETELAHVLALVPGSAEAQCTLAILRVRQLAFDEASQLLGQAGAAIRPESCEKAVGLLAGARPAPAPAQPGLP